MCLGCLLSPPVGFEAKRQRSVTKRKGHEKEEIFIARIIPSRHLNCTDGARMSCPLQIRRLFPNTTTLIFQRRDESRAQVQYQMTQITNNKHCLLLSTFPLGDCLPRIHARL
jgi:hypothetical protein